MRLQQFRCLSEIDQEYYLKEKAVAIGHLWQHEGMYTLFQIDGFYLEVLTDKKNRIIRSVCYEDELDLLDPYLESISLDYVYFIINRC